MNQIPVKVPFRLGQKVKILGGEKEFDVLAIYFVAGEWRIEIEDNGKRLGFFVNNVKPVFPKEYAVTSVYSTRTGLAIGVINGGKK